MSRESVLGWCIRHCYILINPFRKFYWFLFRPHTRGVQCFIEFDGKILFVRLGYAHRSWTIPGGGVNRRETYEEAVRREIKEEVGITLGEIEWIAEYDNQREYKRDHVVVFYANVPTNMYVVDGIEITEARFSPVDHPPTPTAPRVAYFLEILLNHK